MIHTTEIKLKYIPLSQLWLYYIFRMVLEVEYIGQSTRIHSSLSHNAKLLSRSNVLVCIATDGV